MCRDSFETIKAPEISESVESRSDNNAFYKTAPEHLDFFYDSRYIYI